MTDRMLSDEIMLGLIKKNGGGGGGTSNYNQLENLPQIGGVTLRGNKSASDLGLASKEDVAGKQDALTAGQYVDITNDVISVTKRIGTVEPFKETVDYSGEVAKVTVPYAGKYKLCVWGASGGNGTDGLSKGGYGGYSEGIVYLSANTDLYVCVGGAGTGGFSDATAGYNGGGTANHSGSWQRGAGGGATHIATVTGQLKVVSSDNVLIVAGGGGGAGWVNGSEYGTGGSGGGYMGADGIRRNNGTKGNGGTQTAGGTGYEGVGSYGQGGNRTTGQDFGGSGGGGGYYGGGASSNTCGAGGGSGYISTSLTDACMYGYGVPESSEPTTKTISVSEYNENPLEKVAKWGNGYATIEYIEDDTSDLVTKGDVETAINAIKDGQNIDSFADVETALGEKADTDIVASDFSAAASYTAGDYCIYDGKFYKIKNNHSGAWSAADVDEIKIAGELALVKSGLTNITTLVAPTMRDTATLDAGGYIVIGKMVLFDVTYTLTQNVTDTVVLFQLPNAGGRNVGLRITNANDGSEVPSSCRIFGGNVYAGLNGNVGERYNVTGVYMKA